MINPLSAHRYGGLKHASPRRCAARVLLNVRWKRALPQLMRLLSNFLLLLLSASSLQSEPASQQAHTLDTAVTRQVHLPYLLFLPAAYSADEQARWLVDPSTSMVPSARWRHRASMICAGRPTSPLAYSIPFELFSLDRSEGHRARMRTAHRGLVGNLRSTQDRRHRSSSASSRHGQHGPLGRARLRPPECPALPLSWRRVLISRLNPRGPTSSRGLRGCSWDRGYCCPHP